MHKHSFLSSSFSLTMLLASAYVLVAPASAQAGFQWLPPESMAMSQPRVAPAPPIVIESPDVVIDPRAQALKNAPQLPEQVLGQMVVSQPAINTPVAPSPLAAPLPLVESVQTPLVDAPLKGFARNVPLAVALRQILPSDYGFSVERDVDMASIVSWKGGKSWRVTLAEVLADADLVMVEQNQMVSIKKMDSSKGSAAPLKMAAMADAQDSSLPPISIVRPQISVDPVDPSFARSIRQTLTEAGSEPLSLKPSPFETNPSRVLPTPQVVQPVLAPAVMAAAPEVMDSLVVLDTWHAVKGQTLRQILLAWCDKAGVELNWQAEYDYPVQVPVTIMGRFEDVVRTLLKGFEEAKPQPAASLYNNSAIGKPVLVIQVRGNNYGD